MEEQRQNNADEQQIGQDAAGNERCAEVLSCKKTDELEEAKRNFADRDVKEPKRKRAWLGNLFFVVVLAVTLVLVYQLSANAAEGEQKTLKEIFGNMRTDYAVMAVGALFVMIFLDSMKYFVILHATSGKKYFGTSLKTSLLGKYYDNITPFASGGQPFQIHYLHKKGFSGGESTAVIFIKFCFNILIWLAICLCLMVFNRGALDVYVADDTQRRLFVVLGWIGFAINCSIPVVIIAFAVFPKLMETLTRWFLALGYKLKIVKSRDAVVIKAKRIAKDFRAAFVIMTHKPLHAVGLALICVCEQFLSIMLPYLVVVAMAGATIEPNVQLMFAIMTMNVYVSMSVTAVPTPGNSGALETAFSLVLTSVAEGVLFWTVFGWRFLSYYSFILIGLCIFIADFIRKKARR